MTNTNMSVDLVVSRLGGGRTIDGDSRSRPYLMVERGERVQIGQHAAWWCNGDHYHGWPWLIVPLDGDDLPDLPELQSTFCLSDDDQAAAQPLIDRICAGHDCEWDGNNDYGRISADALDAARALVEMIAQIIERDGLTGDGMDEALNGVAVQYVWNEGGDGRSVDSYAAIAGRKIIYEAVGYGQGDCRDNPDESRAFASLLRAVGDALAAPVTIDEFGGDYDDDWHLVVTADETCDDDVVSIAHGVMEMAGHPARVRAFGIEHPVDGSTVAVEIVDALGALPDALRRLGEMASAPPNV